MWWAIVQTPTDLHVFPTGVEDINELVGDDMLNAIRVLTGFPAHDKWVSDSSRWDLQLTFGTPHRQLLERAVEHTQQELRAVTTKDVRAHADERRTAARQVLIDAAAAALSALEPHERDAVLARSTKEA